MVRIAWPPQPTVVDPKRFPDVAAAVAQLFARRRLHSPRLGARQVNPRDCNLTCICGICHGAHIKGPSRVWRYVRRLPAPTRDRVVASAGGWRSGEDSPPGRLGSPRKDHGTMRIRPVPYVVAVLLSTAAIAAFLIGWGWLAN